MTVGETSTLYYDRSKSALPSTSKLVFKAGLNRWESIQLVDMARADGFQQSGGSASEWWSVDFTLPQVGALMRDLFGSGKCASCPVSLLLSSHCGLGDTCTSLLVTQIYRLSKCPIADLVVHLRHAPFLAGACGCKRPFNQPCRLTAAIYVVWEHTCSSLVIHFLLSNLVWWSQS